MLNKEDETLVGWFANDVIYQINLVVNVDICAFLPKLVSKFEKIGNIICNKNYGIVENPGSPSFLIIRNHGKKPLPCFLFSHQMNEDVSVGW